MCCTKCLRCSLRAIYHILMNITESELDKFFIGEWEITQIDDYNSPKAGTAANSAIVRSKVDEKSQTVTLYGYIPERYGTTDISLTGDVGIHGKVTERIRIEAGFTRVDFLWFRAVSASKILETTEEVSPGKYILKTFAEIDDIVYNSTGEYVYPVVYHLRGRNKILRGFEMTIPYKAFNTYIQMRDVWYKDYCGSKKLEVSTESSEGETPS